MVEIKGSAIHDAIESLKKRSGEQVFTSVISSLDNESKATFQKIILSSGWYSLDHFSKFLESDIRIIAHGDESELITKAEIIVENQLKGIYKIFVKLGSPEFVLNKLSAIHKSYFRGVSIEIKMTGPNEAKIKYIGFEKQHRLIGFVIIGFYKKALEISGAKQVNTKYTVLIEEEKGYCELVITWIGK
jgi:hypothetical protein